MEFYDPLYGRIEVPQPFSRIVNSRLFRRLQHLRQLGLCYLSFPGGNHTRFEHSLGAFYLARRIATSLLKAPLGSPDERERLGNILCTAALCHDLGHGPFSHISENIFLALGGKITHEALSAAIILFELEDEFRDLTELGVSSQQVAAVIRRIPTHDPVADCATEFISSDLDVDRLDYLHRDSHYSGVAESSTGFLAELDQVWKLSDLGAGHYSPSLTESGVEFAERMLFLRRNNYQRIVFDSRHMAATSMFEKAVQAHWNSESEFSTDLRRAVESRFDTTFSLDTREVLRELWRVLGQVDYEFLRNLDTGDVVAQYLVRRLRRGQLYDSIRRYQLPDLHVAAKRWVFGLREEKAAFDARRHLEKYLAERAGIDLRHTAISIPKYRPPEPPLLGVSSGKDFTEESALGRFLSDDYIRHYAIEAFLDPQIGVTERTGVVAELDQLFITGSIYRFTASMRPTGEIA